MSLGRSGVLRGKAWAERLLEALALPPRDTAEWMELHTRLVKSDRYSRVGLLELGNELNYLKFYRQKSIAQRLWFWLARGRGVRAYDMGEALLECGIPVPRPRACLRVPQGVLLLTEGLRVSRDLHSLWTDNQKPPDPRGLLAAAGRALGKFHRAGYAHGDCKWSNLLWCGETFYLVDLEAVRRAPVGSRRQGRDLARFTLNAEELAAGIDPYRQFLESYCHAAGIPVETAIDCLLPDLHRLRARHRERYGERGAPLL